MTDPQVTVIVQEITQPSSSTFSAKFSSLDLSTRPRTTIVTDAIALAGGFRDFAKKKPFTFFARIPMAEESRIPFNYKKVIKGKNLSPEYPD